MKILFLNDDYLPFSQGGAAIIVDRLAGRLVKLGHELILIACHPKQEYVEKRNGFKIYWLHINYNSRYRAWLSLKNPQVSSKLQEIFQKEKPDVVHAHNIHSLLTYESISIAKSMGIKVVFTGHDVMPFFYGRLNKFRDTDNDGIKDTLDIKTNFIREILQNKLHYNPLRNLIIKHYLKMADHIVTVSQALQSIYENYDINRVKVIHNGIDPSEWKVDQNKLQIFEKQKHLGKRYKRILLGGRIRVDKGSLVAVDLLKQMPADWQLLIAGRRDANIQEILEYAKQLNITDRIIILGNLAISDMKYAYHASDIILVPSICFDSFPNAVIEGMVCGKPVIASIFGGAKEAIIDGSTGVMINPFDLGRSIAKIKPLLEEKNRKNMGAKARQYVSDHLTLDQQAALYLDLYQASK